MGKIVRLVVAFSLVLLLVFVLSSCEKTRNPTGFDGTLIVTNNSEFTVVVEIDGTVEKSDLAANSQWSTGLSQGPYVVKVRQTDGSNERVYDVDIVSGATTTIRYP